LPVKTAQLTQFFSSYMTSKVKSLSRKYRALYTGSMDVKYNK
jgi:hypothetical protein